MLIMVLMWTSHAMRRRRKRTARKRTARKRTARRAQGIRRTIAITSTSSIPSPSKPLCCSLLHLTIITKSVQLCCRYVSSSVFWPLTSDLCPLSSVLCPLSSLLCPMSSDPPSSILYLCYLSHILLSHLILCSHLFISNYWIEEVLGVVSWSHRQLGSV